MYVFLFNWKSPTPRGIIGSAHGLEIPFVFNTTQLEGHLISPDDKQAQALAEKMSDAWVSFAKTGRPAAKGLPTWDAYDTQKGATMLFDNTCEMRYHFDKALQAILTDFLQ
ncbi:MAG: carboxylesterase family protein [Bacteroidales bacterium]|nr:carboxylesterase family protein [Bacteroidales bacterium]